MAFSTFPDINELLRSECYVHWNTTSTATEAGWGTKIGFSRGGHVFEPHYRTVDIHYEDTGEEIVDKIYIGSQPKIRVTLENYNATLLAILFPGLNSGSTVKHPNNFLSGQSITGASYTSRLMIVPRDSTNHKVLLFQRAAPNILETAKILMSHRDFSTFPVVFDALRKTNDADGIYYMGDLASAVLR